MPQPNDLSRSLSPFVQGNTLVAVIELSLTSWLVAGVVPCVERQPLKKLALDEKELLRAWFKKCHFQVTPKIDKALVVKGLLVLDVTLS